MATTPPPPPSPGPIANSVVSTRPRAATTLGCPILMQTGPNVKVGFISTLFDL